MHVIAVEEGFNADISDAEGSLTQAMDALERERNIFLERLRQFSKKRIKEKMRGCRFPSQSAIEALYKYVGLAFETPKNQNEDGHLNKSVAEKSLIINLQNKTANSFSM